MFEDSEGPSASAVCTELLGVSQRAEQDKLNYVNMSVMQLK
jgi:hypothetical protein